MSRLQILRFSPRLLLNKCRVSFIQNVTNHQIINVYIFFKFHNICSPSINSLSINMKFPPNLMRSVRAATSSRLIISNELSGYIKHFAQLSTTTRTHTHTHKLMRTMIFEINQHLPQSICQLTNYFNAFMSAYVLKCTYVCARIRTLNMYMNIHSLNWCKNFRYWNAIYFRGKCSRNCIKARRRVKYAT